VPFACAEEESTDERAVSAMTARSAMTYELSLLFMSGSYGFNEKD
jgi:hypothetical protein